MKLLGILLYFSVAIVTINARHRKEWKRVDPQKLNRELLLPFYHSMSPACNHGAGFFRDPSDCHQYIRCVDEFSNGRKFSVYVGRCEPGLVFDENISACNWPELAAPCTNTPERIREPLSKFKPKEDKVQHIFEDNVILEQSDTQSTPYPVQEQLVEEHQNSGNQLVQESQSSDIQFVKEQDRYQEPQTPIEVQTSFQEPIIQGSIQETSRNNESPSKSQEAKFHQTPVQEDAYEIPQTDSFQKPMIEQDQLDHEQAVFQEPLAQQQEQISREQPIYQKDVSQQQKQMAQEMPVFPKTASRNKETGLDSMSTQKLGIVKKEAEYQNEEHLHADSHLDQTSNQEKQESLSAFEQIVDDETQQVEIQSNEGYKSEQDQPGWWIPDENNSQHFALEIQTEYNGANPISESATEEPILCMSEGFFSHPENCNQFIRCVKIGQSAFAIHFFECPHQLVFSEKDSSCIVSNAQSCGENNRSKRQVRSAPLECKTEGFFRHPADCRSFYRCVKQPTGSYETHIFSCPDTLVFDEEYATCNWPEKAPPCENKGQSYKTTRRPSYQPPTEATRPSYKPPQRSTSKIHQTTSKPRNGYQDISNPLILVREYTTQRTTQKTKYTTQQSTQKQKYTTQQTAQKPTYTEKPVSDSYGDQKCTGPGFYPHEKDCNKYYKCIKRGDYFVRYELSCPTNFAYDETTSRCIAQRYVSSCSRRRTPYPPKQDDEEITSTEASKPDSTKQSDSDIACTEEGYFRHPDDCNRFYRCVDYNGDGQEFVRYDFKCPEGLVFDETNSVCNWPDQSIPCDGNGGREDGKDSSGGYEEDETGTSSTTTKSTTTKGTDATTESTAQEPSTTSSSSISSESSSTNVITTEDSGNGGSETEASSKGPGKDEQSGTCTQEGFFRNPEDCNKFYRCVDFNGDGQEFVRYDFSCPEGLVFDEINSVCNWPDESAPCDGTSGDESGGNEENQGESSTSTAQEDKDSTSKIESTTSTYTTTRRGSEADSTTSSSSTTRESTTGRTTSASSSTESGDKSSTSDKSSNSGECTEAGFFRNPEDCNKFYRCVDYNGDGEEFVRYDFSCPEGLVFDEVNSVCNWPEQSAPCDTREGSGSTREEKTTTNSYQTTRSTTEYPSGDASTESTYTTESSTSRTQTTRRSTQSSSTTESTYTTQSSPSTSRSTRKPTQSPSSTTESTYTTQSSPSTSRSTRKPTQSPSSTTESTYTTESSTSDNSATSRSTESSESTSGREPGSGEGDVECTEEGFFRNPEDCNKFYRCVDFNGDGQQYVRYDFECPEGLYFDEVNSVCNWPEQSPQCDTNVGRESTSESGTSTSRKEEPSSSGTQSTTQQTIPSSEQSTTGSYTTTQSSTYSTTTQSSTYSTTTQSSTYSTTTQRSNECKEPGFFRYPDDCTKFYRCVDETGDGQELVRYDFKCPEGLIFDDRNKKCDYTSSDSSCEEGSSTTVSQKTTQTTKDYTSSTTSATRSPTTASTPDRTTSSSSSSYGECTEEGFFRNSDDCSKYYRCVDEGDGTFTREDFACAEDEVFDEEMRYCNSKDLAPPCDGSTTEQTRSSQSQGTSSSQSQGSTTAVYPTESSTKSEKSECSRPGFFRCPEDCNKFYRCVDEQGDGQNLVRYDFKCPDGLIFDEKNKKCDWPSSELTCDTDSTTTYSTQSTRTSTTQSSSPKTTKDYTTSTRPSTSGTSGTTSASTTSSDECTEEGFFRNKDDCSKYYRCIDTGYGTYTREDFACAEDEVFDEEMRYCNRKDLAPPCDGSTTGQTTSQTQTTTDKTTTVYTTEKQTSIPTTEKSTTAYPKESSTGGSKSDCEEAGFFRCPEDCNKFYRCVEEKGYLVRYDFKCPEGLIFDEKNKKCDWPSSELTCDDGSSTSSGSYPSTSKTTTSSSPTGTSPPGECTEEGFFRNPDDCSKYFRCLDEGDGTLTREDFACEEDEVFDEEMRYCNRKDLAPPCEDGYSSTAGSSSGSTSRDSTTKPSTSTASESSTSRSTYTTKETSTTEEYESSATEEYENTTKKGSGSGDCEEEGFHRHPDDCSKFYRCVDFRGDGQSFTRYDFDCPEGLVFDEDNDVCNWPSSVPSCESSTSDDRSTSGSPSDSGGSGTSSSTQESSLTSSSESSTTIREGSATSSTTAGGYEDSSSTTTDRQSSTPLDTSRGSSGTGTAGTSDGGSSEDIECTEEGFFRHPEDCSKFYRCVDFAGTGESFVRYDFNCPEGLVFDEVNSVCNWPNMSPGCESGSTRKGSGESSEATSGGSGSQSTTEGSYTPRDDTSTSESSSSSSGTDKTTESPTYGTSSGTTSSRDFQCEEEGFFKNPRDCKKYYECKRDEETGELIKIDCECPEGHIFDSEGWYCNAVELSPPCDDGSFRCTEEGFFRDPEDCTRYYQCNKTGPGNDDFTSENFKCPDGYVFDENGRYCNAPELSEPCDENSSSTKTTKNDGSASFTTSSSSSSSESSTSSPVSQGDCTEEGFFRNPEDCTKYYQCSRSEGTGNMERKDFTCPDGRIFDEGSSYCNDPQLSEEPCENESTSTTEKQTSRVNNDSSSNTPGQTTGSTSSAEGSGTDKRKSGGDPQCTEEGFFRHPDDCNKFYRCVDFSGSGESFVRYDFECPEGLHFDEVNSVCNWPTMTPACESGNSALL